MRTALALIGLFALVLPAGCNCGSVGADSDKDGGASNCGCPAGQTCGPADACVPALSEGSLCGDSLDAGVVTACGPGLDCDWVTSDQKRCSVDCTAADQDTACGPARTCLARPRSVTSSGYCGTAATSPGALCDDATLTRCLGADLVCLSPSGSTQGSCYALCDTTVADPNPDCAPTASCAGLFADPTEGVCVIPTGHYPAECDYSQMKFCARGEVCVRPDDTKTTGYCHLTCKAPQDCPAGQSCTSPSVGLLVCAVPVPRCSGDPNLAPDAGGCTRCSADDDGFCGPDDVCVRVGAASDIPVCKQDCTSAGTVCASGTCQKLQGSDRSACLP